MGIEGHDNMILSVRKTGKRKNQKKKKKEKMKKNHYQLEFIERNRNECEEHLRLQS